MSTNSLDIFNYEFNWHKKTEKLSKKEIDEVCCEKYKNKGEKKCKKCPNRKNK